MGAASKSFHFDLVGLAVDGFIAVSGVSVISPSYHFGVDSFGRGGGVDAGGIWVGVQEVMIFQGSQGYYSSYKRVISSTVSPPTFCNEIAGFQTSSRPCLLKYGR